MNSGTKRSFELYIKSIESLCSGIERLAQQAGMESVGLAADRVAECGRDLQDALNGDETILETR